MRYLQSEGYSTISLYALDRALLTGTPLPRKPIVLTFDDGHIDHYAHVFPLLREYGFTGTFFIITGKADRAVPDYLSWGKFRKWLQPACLWKPIPKLIRIFASANTTSRYESRQY
ncbi:polysaccharide deacetylase family protein [bacterium]|nr:polysaccharide deacetylase family protein [bacterium]